ncbi:MAG: hypothetical protein HZA02_00115 [Nitrospinae bacterium]|nr:hypothetical protein [Nitrospinota bacterium]
MNKDFILEIFYSTKGDIDAINAALDEKLKLNLARKISVFEKFVKSRLAMDPKILKMPHMEITPEETIYLSLYPPLEELEVLDLRLNTVGDTGTAAVAVSPVLRNLRELDLRSDRIAREGIQSLMESRNFANLRKLDLRGNKAGRAWEEKIFNSGNFPRLEELRIV